MASIPPPAPPGTVAAPPGVIRYWGPGDVALGVITVIVATIVGSALVFPFTGTTGADANLGSQAVLELALFGVAFGFARSRGAADPLAALGFRRPAPGWLKTAASAYGIYIVVALLLAAISAEPEQKDVADDLGFHQSVALAILASTLIAVIVPVCEETFFRGFLFGGLRGRLGFVGAAVVSGAIFGAVHLTSSNVVAAIQLAIFGAILAAVYERTGSIGPTILVHCVNNSLAVALLVSS